MTKILSIIVLFLIICFVCYFNGLEKGKQIEIIKQNKIEQQLKKQAEKKQIEENKINEQIKNENQILNNKFLTVQKSFNDKKYINYKCSLSNKDYNDFINLINQIK